MGFCLGFLSHFSISHCFGNHMATLFTEVRAKYLMGGLSTQLGLCGWKFKGYFWQPFELVEIAKGH